ncbi:MAG TPA: uracil-DNA glycosylase [Gemmatimonadaceae bacterium]|nr:uracil-DNA glycosylase [Gemmatimonadaceae bacterium]
MNARDKLRVYLEQRRELGESELLLDSLSVDDVLRTVGAAGRGAASPRSEVRTEATAPEGDWRTMLARGTPPSEEAAAALPPTVPGGIVAGGESDELFNSDIMRLSSLKAIEKAVEACTRCPLYKTANRGVPGAGNPKAKLVCVGEAPGANEDETGLPFVGAAGQLLTKILAAVDLTREEVFIGNVVKHRPPGNRNPTPGEIEACTPYLVRQLELIKPKVILALGTFAAQTLLDTKTPIGKLRGQIHRYHGISVVVTYHPAALLRNPSWKRPTWEDVKLARRILDSATGA